MKKFIAESNFVSALSYSLGTSRTLSPRRRKSTPVIRHNKTLGFARRQPFKQKIFYQNPPSNKTPKTLAKKVIQ